MEANKEEAIRAMKLAEDKMKDLHFDVARKIALKAQNLYPGLDNISQLLSVCDVHCSSQKKIYGSEKDWYGILQVEKLSNEAIVKKQYRRLALYLHPDKNRFPGAEAAFKLICEANAVLSDPSKKAVYDNKIRATSGSVPVNLPPPHMNRHSQFHKPYGSHSSVYTHYGGMQQQTAEPSFWTCCPYCSIKYQYHRRFVNTLLVCQTCFKNFTGCETSPPIPGGSAWGEPMPAKPGVGQTAGFQQRAAPAPAHNKFPTGGVHNVKVSSSKFEYQSSANVRSVQTKAGAQTENASGFSWAAGASKIDLKNEETRKNANANSLHGGKQKADANHSKKASKRKKRGRKRTVESSESCDSSSDSDVNVSKNMMKPGGSGSGCVHFPRRSTRRRQNISYHEDDDDDDDDLFNHLKGSQRSKVSEDNGNEENSSEGKEDNSSESDRNQNRGREASTDHPGENVEDMNGEGGTAPIEIESDSDHDHDILVNEERVDTWTCPDPEFYDFEKNRVERCFDVDQFWACYDETDGMPRFYAKVKKVRYYPFLITFTWLEADPVDEASREWRDANLPIGCGRFKLGKTEKTSRLPTFSHQMRCDQGKTRALFMICPRQGEVWALFKDWDMNWSHDPENHRKYTYELVEVLSEFDELCGIEVCNLDKVPGFVSLFSRRKMNSSFVKPDEMYKFSHCVPCHKLTGSERAGVPVGSFELDPASLPFP
ncbi:uncharacterized protein LOC127263569 [Andrographis paniculata]|uniref:uncharacterized protein LOC127263569 n=1 Tax=Andrographis paniculata TaxID=175694 RepID=UPI0021E94D19|nr:uncharacterized protein LOC127263569 [Andrographis paniculata]XP_051148625.1 uncharacterized protein LOC127263569 [Andrographis paniculata]